MKSQSGKELKSSGQSPDSNVIAPSAAPKIVRDNSPIELDISTLILDRSFTNVKDKNNKSVVSVIAKRHLEDSEYGKTRPFYVLWIDRWAMLAIQN